MNIFWKKYKKFSMLFILLVFLGGVSSLGIGYLMKEINANNENIKKEIINHEERQKRLAEIPELKNLFKMVEKEDDKLNVTLSQNQIIVLIKKLEEIAGITGNEMTIEDMEIKNGEDEKKAKKKSNKENEKGGKKLSINLAGNHVSMKIKLRGSYNNALNFIEKMENMNYCADIISIQLSAEKSNIASQTSGTLLPMNPFIKRSSMPESGESKTEEESVDRVIIDSVLDVVVYFNE